MGGAQGADGTVTGRAGTINNHSATIESAGDMLLNVNQLNNINDHFATELVTVSVIDKLLYQWKGTMYDTEDYNINLDKIETWIICIEGITCRDSATGHADNFNKYSYTETIHETQVKASGPAKLLAGGNLTINDGNIYNENSEIVAGGTLDIHADDTQNVQAEGQRIVTDEGTLKHYWRDHHKGDDSPGIDTSDYTPPATVQASQFSGNTVNINAEHDLVVTGSDVAGSQDILLHGGHDVNITAADEINQETHFNQTTTSGLTGTGGIGVSYGTQDMKVTETLNEHTHRGSTVGSSDGNLTISAGNNLAATNSDLIAGHDMLLKGKNVSILAAQDNSIATQTVEQKTSGLTLALSGAAGSALNMAVTTTKQSKDESNNRVSALEKIKAALTGVQAGQAVAMDSERGTIRIIPTPLVSLSPTAASHQNLNRNRPVTMKRGRDTIMTGALVSGDSVKATVGHDLIMTSEQDSDKYDSKQQSASAGGTFNIGSMGGSASVNLSKDKMHSNYQSVQEQTGIFAGKGGFDIDVANHTQLNGAVIASDANAGVPVR